MGNVIPDTLQKNAKRLILAVVGLCGTGKSEAVSYLAHTLSAPVVYFGGVVLKEVERRGLAVGAANERAVREDLRSKYGMGAIAQLAMGEIETHLATKSSLIIDGLYSFAEYELLEKCYGKDLMLLAVHAARDIRHQRMAVRQVRPLTSEEVDQRDLMEIRNLDKGGPIAIADFHIVNNFSIDSLRNELDTIVRCCITSEGYRL